MLPETGLQVSHFFLSAGEAGQVSCQVGGAGLTISQARELSLQDIAGLLILETAGIPSPTSQLLEQAVGVDTGWREGAEKMALGDLLSLWHSATDVVMRTVPVGASVPLNCRSQERMWSLALDPGSVSSWALFCPKYEAFSSPGGPDLGKWGDHVAGARQGAKLISWATGQLAVAGSSGLRRKVPPSAGLLVCAMHGRARPEGEKQAGWRWWCTFRSTATSLGPLGSSIRALGKCRNWDVLLSGGGVWQASKVRGPWAGSGPQFLH